MNKIFTISILVMFVFSIGLVSADVNPEKCHDVKVKIKIIEGEEVIEFKIHKNSCTIDLPFLNGNRK